jgi:hypothetical protein
MIMGGMLCKESGWTARALGCCIAVVVASHAGCYDAQKYTPLGGLEVSVPDVAHVVHEGTGGAVPVRIVRGDGRVEPIAIVARGLPLGVTADPLILEAPATGGSLVLQAQGAALGVQGTFVVEAQGLDLNVESNARLFIAGRPGSVDRAFGTQGHVSVPLAGGLRPFSTPDGKLTLIGGPEGIVRMFRFLPNGAPDLSFGVAGVVEFASFYGMPRERYSAVTAVVHDDGSISASTGLDSPTTTTRPDALVAFRLLPNGTADSSFGVGGFAKIDGELRPYATAIDGNDILVWNGHAADSILTRFRSAGSISSSPVLLAPDIVHIHADMVVQSDGKIIVPTSVPAALLRFTSNLQVDSTFGRNGFVARSGEDFSLLARNGEGYSAVGYRQDIASPYYLHPHVIEYDAEWRVSPGFPSAGTSFEAASSSNNFASQIAVDDGTIAAGNIDGGVRLGHVVGGEIDQGYGPGGLALVDFVTNGEGLQGIAATDRSGLFAVISRNSGQSIDIFRVWR